MTALNSFYDAICIKNICVTNYAAQMVEFLETHGLIKDSQHGFRRGRSCLTNLLCFLDKVTSCLDDKDCMDIVFLDLAKAFDKVPHRRLMEKIAKHGIGGRPPSRRRRVHKP